MMYVTVSLAHMWQREVAIYVITRKSSSYSNEDFDVCLIIYIEKTKGKISVQIDEPTNLFLMNIYVYDISYANIHESYRKEVFCINSQFLELTKNKFFIEKN